ncbi:MAG: efflux RND transporter periplasmic adaptor subunit [Proteobacteria bacterium]|nr:efflux RND transporter periplasmic adaptor subunit [Pseudomonadota bacterium]MBU1420174.1 efflux RND transporter periplasmic adaptor subunit [Pseudomonadota bacterium]MBU1455220.1 efflux RND transporter periplasmic adaptor subunit [Pseudomonadota bacterium]
METERKYFGSKKSLLIVLVAVMVGIVIGYAMRGDDTGLDQKEANVTRNPDTVQSVDQEHTAHLQSTTQKETRVYVCPMNCVPPMEKPGTCPVCGMELVAADGHRHEEGLPRLSLADEDIKAAGIQVAPVERREVAAEIRLFGKVEYDPVYQYKVTAFAPGVIDKIYVTRAGETVKTGDPLFDLYSIELYFLEQELFAALEKLPSFLANRPAMGQRFKGWVQPWKWEAGSQRPSRRDMIRMSMAQPTNPEKENTINKEEKQSIMEEVARVRREIGSLGLSEAEVDRIIARGWPTGISTVITPINGIVMQQDAYKSMYVNTGDSIVTIADPQFVWAMLDAFASDIPWIKLGQQTEFRSDAYPGETFRGEVTYLDPYFDDKTRTFKVGVLCTDHKGKLKPGMLVRGTMYAKPSSGYRVNARQSAAHQKMLAIPETAPLITGKRAVVYVEVADKPGTYEGREVILGPRAKGYYMVRQGLQEGEKVVVNGNFKIDSAVQILAGKSMMSQMGSEMMHDKNGDKPAMEMDMKMAPQGMKP